MGASGRFRLQWKDVVVARTLQKRLALYHETDTRNPIVWAFVARAPGAIPFRTQRLALQTKC